MAIVTLEYDGRNSAIKKLIEVIVSLGAKDMTSGYRKKECELDKAIREIESGKTIKCEDYDDYLKKIRS
ncbi:MAG: hypothetical protein KBT67_06770 [bacterium]|nr:hypothetical protein [Candidatus Limimorpha caballi]MCQ2316567.1 hypothetical protein [Bacteroidales bacterium]